MFIVCFGNNKNIVQNILELIAFQLMHGILNEQIVIKCALINLRRRKSNCFKDLTNEINSIDISRTLTL